MVDGLGAGGDGLGCPGRKKVEYGWPAVRDLVVRGGVKVRRHPLRTRDSGSERGRLGPGEEVEWGG